MVRPWVGGLVLLKAFNFGKPPFIRMNVFRPLFFAFFLCMALGGSATLAQSPKASLLAQLPLRSGQPAILTSIRLHQSDTLATATADSLGRVRFDWPAGGYVGFYRVLWKDGQSLVLWDGKPLEYVALGPDSVDVLRGEAWQTYRNIRQRLLSLRSRRQLLLSLRREFPDADELHRSAQKQILLLEQEDQTLLARINDPKAETGLRFLRPEAPFLGQNPEEMRPQLRTGTYLKLARLDDTALVHHPVLANMIVEYYRLLNPIRCILKNSRPCVLWRPSLATFRTNPPCSSLSLILFVWACNKCNSPKPCNSYRTCSRVNAAATIPLSWPNCRTTSDPMPR